MKNRFRVNKYIDKGVFDFTKDKMLKQDKPDFLIIKKDFTNLKIYYSDNTIAKFYDLDMYNERLRQDNFKMKGFNKKIRSMLSKGDGYFKNQIEMIQDIFKKTDTDKQKSKEIKRKWKELKDQGKKEKSIYKGSIDGLNLNDIISKINKARFGDSYVNIPSIPNA
jgi:hypothetical protein